MRRINANPIVAFVTDTAAMEAIKVGDGSIMDFVTNAMRRSFEPYSDGDDAIPRASRLEKPWPTFIWPALINMTPEFS